VRLKAALHYARFGRARNPHVLHRSHGLRHLNSAAKEEKSREKRYEQDMNVRFARPDFADPSHNYF